MPRTLPWLVDTAKDAKTNATGSSSPARKPQRAVSSGDLVDSDLNTLDVTAPQKLKKQRRPDRTPSTSPPPAPPDVEYMREDCSADDSWLMVEDEFLSTAKTFTQHIHHAEYVRLKKLARSQGARMPHSIDRPVAGMTEQSVALKLKLEAEAEAKKRKQGLKTLLGEESSSEEEDEYMHDPQLAGLMTRETSLSKDLSGILKARSNTRAAAGFSESPGHVKRKRDALTLHDGVKNGRSVENSSRSEEVEYSDESLPPSARETTNILKRFARDAHIDDQKERDHRQARGVEDHATKVRKSGSVGSRADTFTVSKERADLRKRHPDPEDFDQVTAGDDYPRGQQQREREARAVSPDTEDWFNTRHGSGVTLKFHARRKAPDCMEDRNEKRNKQRADDVPTFII